jgi:asparagine synthase (glutamine-hydrolysing)
MSGFAGIVGRGELAEMIAILERTAPHGTSTAHADGASLAYAPFESGPKTKMPISIDGVRWIVGDCDATVVLDAYRRWGKDVAAHLTGDFAFAIWDAEARSLFAARDAFGVKPFYYAHRDDTFVFSSALAAVKSQVANDLDHEAIAEFLLFSIVLNPAATTFAQIRTLPAGHSMLVRDGSIEIKRWFDLPIEEPLRFRDRHEVIDAFNEHLNRAVASRISGSSITTSMSGGLDSTTITTVATELLRAQYASPRVTAYTIVWDPLVPDDEERFARAVAQRLDIDLRIIRADRHRLFEKWDDPSYLKDEPSNDPFSAITTDQFRDAATNAPVMLAGQGGDAVFYASHSYFWQLLRRARFIRFFREIASHAIRKRRLPSLGLRSSLRKARGIRAPRDPYPAWIHYDLRERWDDYWNDLPEIHPTRPQAHSLLLAPGWQRLNEYTDPAAMRARIEYRNPYLDIPLVRFLLRVPPMPWFAEKELPREAMRGRLPELARLRRKTPIGMDPAHIWIDRQRGELQRLIEQSPELDRWVDRRALGESLRSPNRSLYDSFLITLPLCLAHWLHARR